MLRIRNRTELESAAEEDLCNGFLIPLYKSMGFCDVMSHHGGALEQGKDIVMWSPSPFGVRENYAVVVKATKVSGVVRVQNEVLTQIRQALATEFRDRTTSQPQQVHKVVVVSNKDITKEAQHALGPVLKEEHLDGRVSFQGIDALWELAEEHLMPSLVLDSLSRARLEMLTADPDYQAEGKLTREGVEFSVAPKHDRAPPLVINAEPGFPDTEEGRRKREEYAEFIRSGRSISVDDPLFPLINPPQILKYLAPPAGAGPYELSMPARPIQQKSIVRLVARVSNRESEIPYVQFTTLHGGLIEFTLTNEDQPIPIRVRLTIEKGTERYRLTWSLTPEKVPLYWAATYFEFVSALVEGATLEIEDLHFGGIMRLLKAERNQVDGPPAPLLALLRAARIVEEKTKKPIVIANLEELSLQSLESAQLAELIVERGELVETDRELTLTTKPSDPAVFRQMLSAHRSGGFGVKAGNTSYLLSILGTEIDLGPWEAQFDKMLFHPEDLPTLEAAAESGASNDLRLRLVSVPGTLVRITFANWRKVEQESGSLE